LFVPAELQSQGKQLSEDQLAALFALLCKRGIIKLDGAKVSYELPSGP
jgi:hypothetical protein